LRAASTTTISSLNVWYSFDISALAQDWAANPANNHGVILVPLQGPTATYNFYSAESPHLGWRPKLTLYYRVP
jgi:hypothetical protein